MIHVSRLTRRFARTTAIDDLSFDVFRGEIVGLLGPNGAGKSTTLRTLTGYLPASRGEVFVAGLDVSSHSLEVRQKIGYLPEHCALYPELRVDEYLTYRARLKGVKSRALRERLADVKSMCALEDSGKRIIGNLSKGYRQRVGLADSLIHQPELLILDEPTAGLDPNQIHQMRALISSLARQHTVLLSTHLLGEAAHICSRLLILDRGRLVACGSPDELSKRFRSEVSIRLRLKAPAESVRVALIPLSDARPLELRSADEWSEWMVWTRHPDECCDAIYALCRSEGWHLRELAPDPVQLDDVFRGVTGSTNPETRV